MRLACASTFWSLIIIIIPIDISYVLIDVFILLCTSSRSINLLSENCNENCPPFFFLSAMLQFTFRTFCLWLFVRHSFQILMMKMEMLIISNTKQFDQSYGTSVNVDWSLPCILFPLIMMLYFVFLQLLLHSRSINSCALNYYKQSPEIFAIFCLSLPINWSLFVYLFVQPSQARWTSLTVGANWRVVI